MQPWGHGFEFCMGTLFPPKFILLLIIEHVQGSIWKRKSKIPAKNITSLQIENWQVNCNILIIK